MTNDKKGRNVPQLEITEVVLVRCNIDNSECQQNSEVVYTFIQNKPYDQLLDISSKNFLVLKAFNPEFPFLEVWFSDQKLKPLGIEDKISITLVVN